MDDNFHKSASISDKISAVGELEHILYHARKSASVKIEDKELETFFQTVARMTLDFRRRYMKKHFPDCPEELWCLGKAVETARQRIYEADEGDTEDLNDIDAIWNMIWEKITGEDLSGCSNCREDKGISERPFGPDECTALYIGDMEGLERRKFYRISVGQTIVPDNDIDTWSVAVEGDDGKTLAILHYGGVDEIEEDWMFETYPDTYKKAKEGLDG